MSIWRHADPQRSQHCRQKVDSARHMEAVRTPSWTGVRAKHGSLVIAKAKGGGRLLPLPFTTFGGAAVGLAFRPLMLSPLTGVLVGVFAIGVETYRDLMQPTRRSNPVRPLAGSGEAGARPIERRFGLDAVPLVAYPDSHAGVEEGLHSGIDLAVVELLKDAL